MKQTILGAGGAIGTDLAKCLAQYTNDIRLVSRNPKKVNDSDELFPCDVTVRENVFRAIEGSSKDYVTVGFEYNRKVWQALWPPFISNVVDACLQYNCELVFFDNMYAIAKNSIANITEESPVNPGTEKGKIRAQVENIIIEATEKRGLRSVIARAPDFYGPVIKTSALMIMVYENLKKGKKAQWLCNPDVLHTFGYTPDLAKGFALLGNTAEAYNQIWNLPVDRALTGREWVNLFANELQANNRITVLPAWGVRLAGLFVPFLSEIYEMLYQNQSDYVFNSDKFNKAFQFTPTTNEAGVKEVIQLLKE